MATVAGYFKTDFSLPLRLEAQWHTAGEGGLGQAFESCGLVDARAGAKYVALYFPGPIEFWDHVVAVTLNASSFLDKANKIKIGRVSQGNIKVRCMNVGENTIKLTYTLPGDDHEIMAEELPFSGRVYLYLDEEFTSHLRPRLSDLAGTASLKLTIRGPRYAQERSVQERPLGFISHDSRDKNEIARTIAIQLLTMQCSVWYDEFSLNVGDSIKETLSMV
jgi:hypothetical protein